MNTGVHKIKVLAYEDDRDVIIEQQRPDSLDGEIHVYEVPREYVADVIEELEQMCGKIDVYEAVSESEMVEEVEDNETK